MHISGISLNNYKNYIHHVYELHPRVNLIVGLNGVGKTNLLDALYYSSIGKSYTTSSDRHTIRKGEDYMRLVTTYIDADNHKRKITIKVQKDKGKSITLDGKKYKRISEHIGRFPCVMIAPTDVQSLLDASESRRKFIDQSIIQYDNAYLKKILTYNRLLRQRNALLKQFAERRTFDALLLDSISIKMYQPAEYIHSARTKFVNDISEIFKTVYKQISGDKEQSIIRYKSSLTTTSLSDSMAESQERDRVLQRTTKGIHKDDLQFLMNDDPLKVYASQGQLKSFVMALKLCQYKIIQKASVNTPTLLLDDIFDKLDQERVKHILDILLSGEYGQIVISDTNLYRVENILQILETNYTKYVIDTVDHITTYNH